MSGKESPVVESILGKSPDLYSQFLQTSLLPNKPTLIKLSSSRDWLISRRIDELGPVNGILSLFHTNCSVPVDVLEGSSKGYDTSRRMNMSIHEFFNRCEVDKERGLYLKDWHAFLHKDSDDPNPNENENTSGDIYDLPDIFADDWLNWYYRASSKRDDYKFIYIGGAETYTALHHDVCCSYSWSINLYGSKKWSVYSIPS